MTKRIQALSDLPDWFNLPRYSWTKTIDPVELVIEFSYRAITHDAGKSHPGWPHMLRLITSGNGRVVSNSAIPNSESTSVQDFERELAQQIGENIGLVLDRGAAVSPLQVNYVTYLANRLAEHLPSPPHQDGISLMGGDTISFDAYMASKVDSPDDFGERVKCEIDLTLSDQTILRELRELLPLWRKSLSEIIGQELSSGTPAFSDLEKISHYRVIPLLDLVIWAKEAGSSIPLRLLRAAIFPNGERGEDDIRKMIFPFIERMTTTTGISRLRSAALVAEDRG
ncbi:MAG: DUF6387 family protein [Gammaproteobacteria bacterium]